jgi:DNA-binding LacI/PurR family transcriptional regulator
MTRKLAFCSTTTNPYFDAVLEAIRLQVRQDPELELIAWEGAVTFPPAAIPYLKPDGVLVDVLTPEEFSKLPEGVQVLGYSHREEEAPYCRVVNHDEELGKMAAGSLLEAGYTHWMVFVDEDTHFANQRIRGMRAVAEEEGIPLHRLSLCLRKSAPDETFQDVWLEHITSLETTLKALHPNTAIITTSEAMAAEVLETLKEYSHKRIPEELGLMVADRVRQTDLALASLELDVEEISRRLLDGFRRRFADPGCRLPENDFVSPLRVVTGGTLRPPGVLGPSLGVSPG